MPFAALAQTAVSAIGNEIAGQAGLGPGMFPAAPQPTPDIITPTASDGSTRTNTFAPQFSGENSTNSGSPVIPGWIKILGGVAALGLVIGGR